MTMSSSADRHLPPLIPNLPDDISARCIALLPFSSRPILSLVSRSWLSFLRSPLFLSLRLLSPHKQPFLLLSIRSSDSDSGSLWFLLHPYHHHHHHHHIQPLPPPPLPTLGSACVPAGPLLFLVGGSLNDIPSRSVQILDPRSRRPWSQGPSLSSPRHFPAAASVSSSLFVLGGCLPSSPNWAEYLTTTKTGTGSPSNWAPLPSPFHLRDKWMHGCAILDGKLLAVADKGGVMFDPATKEWGPVPAELDLGWKGRAAVVGGILYTYDYLGKVKGYDMKANRWMQVEGLEKELPRFLCGATLADLGGFLCLVWERSVVGKGGIEGGRSSGVEICCAGIGIERTEEGGLRGNVVWLEEGVLVVPRGSTIAHCVDVEL